MENIVRRPTDVTELASNRHTLPRRCVDLRDGRRWTEGGHCDPGSSNRQDTTL